MGKKKTKPRRDRPDPLPKRPRPLGLDSAWISAAPQLDGETVGLLWRYVDAYANLWAQLMEAEHAVAQGQRRDSGPSTGHGDLTGKLAVATDADGNQLIGPDGKPVVILADFEGDAEALRRLQRRVVRRLRHTVELLEKDMGLRTPIKGPRDREGRLQVLVSDPA